jgi:putative ABC transport system ATP-binding protein
MLTKVGLGARLNHRPKEMSGGQQQRVGIARAFVAKPEIVFADEPTGNLDSKTTMEVMKLIRAIAKDNNQTIVMVTHDRRLADFADRIIHIFDGKIQEVELKTPVIAYEVSENEVDKELEEELSKEIVVELEDREKDNSTDSVDLSLDIDSKDNELDEVVVTEEIQH